MLASDSVACAVCVIVNGIVSSRAGRRGCPSTDMLVELGEERRAPRSPRYVCASDSNVSPFVGRDLARHRDAQPLAGLELARRA